MRRRAKVATLTQAVLAGRLQHNLKRLGLRVPGWLDPRALADAPKASRGGQCQGEGGQGEGKGGESEEGSEEGRRSDEESSEEGLNLDRSHDDDDDDNASTYIARSLSSMSTGTLLSKADRTKAKRAASAMRAELAAVAAEAGEAARAKERAAAAAWLEHSDEHAAAVADALLGTEVERC